MFNVTDASEDELKTRLNKLREDRKSYGLQKRSTKKKAVNENDLFKGLPPEVVDKIINDLTSQIESGELKLDDADVEADN